MSNKQQPNLVVGVGASAGGLEAFKQLIPGLPSDSGMAFLLVQHLDPTHKSLLTELLDPITDMPVVEAEQGMELLPDHIYIIRPGTAMAVKNGKIELSEPTLHRGVRLPVDHLFRSLAQEYGARSAAIILSGAGSDGSAGIRDIKTASGLTIAQRPGTQVQPGMPQSAIDTGIVDLVLAVDDMPEALKRFAALPTKMRLTPPTAEDEQPKEHYERLGEEAIHRLAAILVTHKDFDLRVYKPGTIERRVFRRMALSGFEENIEDYLNFLRDQPAEQQTLVRDLLINVTEFFRDSDAFSTLRDIVIDPLIQNAKAGSTIRAWVPGCATGEEAFSLAIELLEAIEQHEKHLNIQIFATDVDEDALAFARMGVYPLASVKKVPSKRRAKYFKEIAIGSYQVASELRDIISFAVHDLTKDPPFSRMHLVTCRNVMIYLTAEAQKHVLKILHFALVSDGHLFLSTSESTGAYRELFSTVSKSYRIYRKLGVSRTMVVPHSRTRPYLEEAINGKSDKARPVRLDNDSDHARKAVLEVLVPPTLVVAEDGRVILAHGELSPYLKFPEGDDPQFELNSVLRAEFATRVRGVLYKCRRDKQSVSSIVTLEKDNSKIKVSAFPASKLGDNAVIISFDLAEESLRDPNTISVDKADNPTHEIVLEELEKELQATREDLRNTVEELETSNEELRSSNEESMSMNEELQSANEELEATTEELRSLNEELTTVNAQLREKVELLEQAHDDLNNFFASTNIATIFLDEHLCIKRFTSVAKEILGIDQSDIGRYVGDIARELLQNELVEDAQQVLLHLTPNSRELRTQKNQWITRQVLPYRTESRRIEGVVVTFADISELKEVTQKLSLRERQQSVVSRIGLLALQDEDLYAFMDNVVREVRHTLDADYCKLLELQPSKKKLLLRAGVGWRKNSVGALTEDGGLSSPAGYALQAQEPVIIDDINTDKRFSVPPILKEHGITSGISCVIRDGDFRYGVLGAFTRSSRQYTEEDVHFLQAVASFVGSTIGQFQGRARLAMELAVTQVLAEAVDLDETLDLLLDRMTRELGSSFMAELWWWEESDARLERRAIHVTDPRERNQAEQHLDGGPFKSGETLIGEVHELQRAIWITELDSLKDFGRAEGAKSMGLRSGVMLPILSGRECLGVIAIYSSELIFADDVYLHSLESVGRAIGDFIARWQSDQTARLLGDVTAASHDAIFSYDKEGIITLWLSGAVELFGYSEADMLGQNVNKIVPEDCLEEFWAVNERIAKGEREPLWETTRVDMKGRKMAVSERTSPVKDRNGQIVGFTSTDRDISQMKETQMRLMEANRQKDEFIAMLGHELRNPLSAICSAAELLKLNSNYNSESLQKTQAIINRQSAHMAKLLDGLLDVSRIIRGKIQLEKQPLDLVEVCREVCSDVMSRLGHRKLEVIPNLPDNPLWVYGDRVRLTQVVDNLLSNAVKYTKDNGTINIELKADNDDAILVVRDTGVGIDDELLPHVFEVFRQSRQNLDRSSGGLGLGLALVNSLVKLHKGTVKVRSEGFDQGSEFTVSIPLTHRRPARSETGAKLPLSLSILIVEDNEDSAHTLKEILELSGHSVIVAGRVPEGVAMANEHLPNVVICDIGLPDGLTGYDFARQLRSQVKTQDIPLIALSGYGRPEDKTRCVEAGFDHHLTKPTNYSAISRVLSELRIIDSHD